MKWQNILKVTGGSSVSVFAILLLVLNITGMSYDIPADQFCDDCYDSIYVNSTYFEIKVEHAGMDQDIIFAKRTRSRTRWLNLDKINEFVETSPEIFVEILVPTVKRYSTVKHPELGYLRPIKDGDSLIKRKSVKYNPRGSWFVVHGLTGGKTTKWGFNMDSWTMDGVVFDPVWKSPYWYEYIPSGFSFDLIKKCWNESKIRYESEVNEIWIEKNNTYENDTTVIEIYYKVEDCEEIGINIEDKDIKYKQLGTTCLRTDSTLCCWDNRDGGSNLNSRNPEFRTTILSGESGFCKDLNDNLKELSYQSDWGKLELTTTLAVAG